MFSEIPDLEVGTLMGLEPHRVVVLIGSPSFNKDVHSFTHTFLHPNRATP